MGFLYFIVPTQRYTLTTELVINMADFNWGCAEQSHGNAIFNSQAANGQWKAGDATNQTQCPKFSGVKPHDLTAAKVLPASATLKQASITHPAYYSSVTVTQSNGNKKTF